MNKKYPVFFIAVLLVLSFPALPTRAEDDVDELKRQVQALQERVKELEKAQDHSYQRRQPPPQPRTWDPFTEIERMQEEMNRMFDDTFRRGNSSRNAFVFEDPFQYDFDLKETDDGYMIKFDISKLNKDKMDIQIDPHSITIKGEYSREEAETSPSRTFQSKSFGSFLKTIPLPMDADTSKAKTEQKGDTLVITVPKKTT